VSGFSFDPGEMGGRAGSMSNTHLGQEVGDVVLDRLFSQKQIISNFSVGSTCGDLLKDDPLALS
jgi:hypothetical protein